MRTARLCDLAEFNPPCPAFVRLEDDAPVAFIPMEGVWPNALQITQRPKAEVAVGYTRFQEGDLLVPKISPTFSHGRASVAEGLVGGVGTGTTELHVLRARPGVDPRWLAYVAKSAPFLQEGESTEYGVAGQKRIDVEWLRSFRVPAISPDAQRRIVDFLDLEIRRIDDLAAEQGRLAELLLERESSRLDELFERLSEGSPVCRLGALVHEWDQRLGEQEAPPLLSVSIHDGVVPRSDLTEKLPRADDLAQYKLCDVGDIVLNRLRAFQGGVGRAPCAGIVSPDYTVLRPRAGVESHFLYLLMRSPRFIGEMTARLRGIGQPGQGNVRTPRVNYSDLRLIRVPCPPHRSQLELAEAVGELRHRTDALRRELEAQVGRLLERRKALITAAVTGGLDDARKVA